MKNEIYNQLLEIIKKISFEQNKKSEFINIFYSTDSSSADLKKKFITETLNSLEDSHLCWLEINELLRKQNVLDCVLIANGDINCRSEGEQLCRKYNLDGVMIGRGIFANPCLFANTEFKEKKIHEKLQMLLNHLILWKETWLSEDTENETSSETSKKHADPIIAALLKHKALGTNFMENKNLKLNKKHFPQLKKYFKIYISSFDGATKLREQLMKYEDIDLCIDFVQKLIKQEINLF